MDTIKQIEAEADKRILELEIWKRPAHLILSALNNVIYELFFFDGQDSLDNRYKAERMISYLAGVAPYLSQCSGEVLKISQAKLVEFSDEMKGDMRHVIEYGQFCTIMDRVHKGDFTEDSSGDRVRLNFGGPESFDLEAKDVLISELSLPHFLQPKQVFDPIYTLELGSGSVFLDPRKVAQQVIAQRKEVGKNEADIEYVADFSNVISDLTSNEYKSLKSSIISLALYCRSVARLLLEAVQGGLVSGERANSNLTFWKSPCLKESDVVLIISIVADVSIEKAETFIKTFTLTIGEKCPNWVKSGYFPPFQKVGDRLIFCPAILMVMMTNRNAIYLCAKTNEETFHGIVSAKMEPKLIEDFVLKIPGDKGWKTETAVDFPGGEIDLVCFNERLKLVLQVQAKGSISPEGAVLVRNFESRCKEGIEQLRRFEALGHEGMVESLQSRFPEMDSEIRIVPALLARGSFGRPEFLSQNKDVMFINPMLGEVIFSDENFDWRAPTESLATTATQILEDVDCKSNYEEFFVFDAVFDIELPHWNRAKLTKMMVRRTLGQIITSGQ